MLHITIADAPDYRREFNRRREEIRARFAAAAIRPRVPEHVRQIRFVPQPLTAADVADMEWLYLANLARAGELAYADAHRPKTLNQIMHEVAHKHGFSVLDLKSARRPGPLVIARQEYYWRARNETIAAMPQIARFCGNRDHSTIVWGIRQHEQRLRQRDPQTRL